MSARINQYRSAVVASIKTALPALRSCEEQFGRFDLDELERTSIPAPAVRVAVLKARCKPQPNGQTEATLSCAAFVVTDGSNRDSSAWTIAEAIVTRLEPAQLWGLTKLEGPQGVEIQPVVGLKLRQRAVAIIAVEWTQTLRQLGSDIFDAAGVVVEGLYIGDDAIVEAGDD